MTWCSRATLILAIIAAIVVPSIGFSTSLAVRPKFGGGRVEAASRPAPVGGLASLAMQLADGTKNDEAAVPSVSKEVCKPNKQQEQRAPVESPQSSRIPQGSGRGTEGSATKSSSSGQDWAVRLVESSPDVRRAIAFPVAFASSANWLSQCIYVAAKLRIPDALADGPMAVDQLAREVDAHPEALGRLLRSLSGQGPIPGLFVEVYDSPIGLALPIPPPLGFLVPNPPKNGLMRRYALTPLGAMLREEGTGSLRPWVLFSGEELGKAWGGLLTAVKEGSPDFGVAQGDAESGISFWEYMERFPEKRETFDNSMQALSDYSTTSGEAASKYDFSMGGKAEHIVDVGGGTGRLLAGVLAKNPGMRGTLFDQVKVLAEAGPVLDQMGVRERVELAPGSFFDSDAIPGGADVYMMKNIIHDWADAESLAILRRVGDAMRLHSGGDSTLAILDLVRSSRRGYEPWSMDFADFFDLNMLVTVGGRERSMPEWETLLDKAGMRVEKVEYADGLWQAGAPAVLQVKLK